MITGRSRILKQILLIIISILFFSLTMISSKLSQMNLGAYNGVLLAIQFVLCLCMVLINYRTGFIISISLLLISLASMLVVLLRFHDISPLPGICNMGIYVITIFILCTKFNTLDKNAITDLLTGLKNRRGLYNILDNKILNKKPFYVVYLDLGNFKMINDNYGHFYGDSLLKLVTQRITDIVGKNGIVTRIGGDEFVLIINDNVNVHGLTEKVIASVSQKADIPLNGVIIQSYLTAFAGITYYPDDATTSGSLIKYADIAMYHATKNRTDHIFHFTKELELEFARRIEVEKIIKEALTYDNFFMEYQPQYEISDKKLRGLESLIRMRSQEGEIVSPAEFIPIAEASDLILKIDDYVLNRVMKEFKESVTNNQSDLIISVNVSAKNIASIGFPQKVKEMLKRNDFPPQNLEIEITEYCLVSSVETTIENIKELRNMGLHIALDDFGTGYTSLSYLSKMPINLVKIDKSLIDDITSSNKSKDFVTAVVSMGHIMGCKVISEGVENQDQLKILKDQNCDYIQGFVWSKPVSYEYAKTLVKDMNK